MSEINLPPFYIGQKVVCLKPSTNGRVQKNSFYTVLDCFQCPKCKMWHITLSELPDKRIVVYNCMCDAVLKNTLHFGGPAKYFAPVQENFQSISIKKILEKEAPLISAS